MVGGGGGGRGGGLPYILKQLYKKKNAFFHSCNHSSSVNKNGCSYIMFRLCTSKVPISWEEHKAKDGEKGGWGGGRVGG